MIRLDQEQVLRLHTLLTEQTGGDPSLRDAGLLESALASVYQTFDGVELYPTLLQKAARLGFALISNHAFVDGNKRIGVLVMLTFLAVNGVPVSLTDADIVKIGLGIADGSMKYEELLVFLQARCV